MKISNTHIALGLGALALFSLFGNRSRGTQPMRIGGSPNRLRGSECGCSTTQEEAINGMSSYQTLKKVGVL